MAGRKKLTFGSFKWFDPSIGQHFVGKVNQLLITVLYVAYSFGITVFHLYSYMLYGYFTPQTFSF